MADKDDDLLKPDEIEALFNSDGGSAAASEEGSASPVADSPAEDSPPASPPISGGDRGRGSIVCPVI